VPSPTGWSTRTFEARASASTRDVSTRRGHRGRARGPRIATEEQAQAIVTACEGSRAGSPSWRRKSSARKRRCSMT